MKMKFKLFGHITIMSNRKKLRSVMMGMMEGNLGRGYLVGIGWMTLGTCARRKLRTSGRWILMKMVDGNSVCYQTNLKHGWLGTNKLNSENKIKFIIHSQSQNWMPKTKNFDQISRRVQILTLVCYVHILTQVTYFQVLRTCALYYKNRYQFKVNRKSIRNYWRHSDPYCDVTSVNRQVLYTSVLSFHSRSKQELEENPSKRKKERCNCAKYIWNRID